MKKSRTTHKKLLSLLIVMIMLVSIAPANLFSVTASAVSGSEIVAYARQFLGYPYVWGAEGPDSFDCSGLVQYVFNHFGISLPRTTDYYWNNPTAYGTVVGEGSTANARAGDIISWSGHVAIYTENGYCVEALNPTYGVTDKFKVDSHTNGLNYRVIRIYGVSDDTSIPTEAWIWSDKTMVAVGEEVKFNYNAKGAYKFVLGTYYNNELSIVDVGGNDWHTATYDKPGKYYVHAACYNSLGHCDSNQIVIEVYDSKPTDTWIQSDKTKVAINETINFSYGATNAVWYVVGIYLNGEMIYIEDLESATEFSYSFDEIGTYFIHFACYNSYGLTDTPSVKIDVYDPNQTFNITYNPNGGENAPANQTKKYGESITISSSEPTRDGYVFLGWSTDSNATEPEYLPGDTYLENKDITLYAVWEKAVNEYTIKGALKTFGNSDDEILVDFYKPGESESCGYTIFRGDAEEFCIGGIQQGEYIIKISKPNHVTREYSVVVDKDIELDIQLNLIGDVDGNGKVNITDYNAILRHVKKKGALDGYAFDCADVDGNSRIMVTDYNAVLRHVKKIETLW